jgi:hypothetical protein
MQRNRAPSAQAISVLRALAADPTRWRYGYDLATEVHLRAVRSAHVTRTSPRGSEPGSEANGAAITHQPPPQLRHFP